MFEDWKIKIIDRGYKLTRDIYIFRQLPNGEVEFLNGGKSELGVAMDKPTLELFPEQLQAFADALNEQGFKPQKGFVEGKLEGTERHLTDLRKLLKLLDKEKER